MRFTAKENRKFEFLFFSGLKVVERILKLITSHNKLSEHAVLAYQKRQNFNLKKKLTSFKEAK